MSLHISRVEIKNFRNFHDLVIDNFPAHAVIVGENGVGKSNLLEAIRLVLDPSLPDTRRQLRAEDIWEGHPAGLAGGAEVTVVVELQGYDTDDDAKAVLSAATVNINPYTARLTYRFARRTEIDPTAQRVQAVARPLTAQDYDFVVFGGTDENSPARNIRREIALRVLPALRDAEGDLQQWRRSPLRDLLERLPLDPTNLKTTADAVASAVEQLTQDGNVAKLEQHLSKRLGEMFGPRLAIEPTLGFASTDPDELIRSVRLFVDTARRRGIADTSLGSANVIYLGLLLEALNQQRRDDQFVATFVAIEEPEAHLHVSLQRQLFGYLLRSGTTLMLTTHSPHIAAVAPVGSFVVLRNTDQGTVGVSTAALPLSAQEAADLERYIDVSRAEVLFAAAVILVEGLAELYVLPALATAAGFDLDAYGAIVASAHGTDFKPYRTLLGRQGLNTPHVIVTDGDAAEDGRGVREAGLKRAAGLHSNTARGTAIRSEIEQLPPTGDVGYAAARALKAQELQAQGVFVGAQTLETDLCGLFGPQITAAFQELSSNTRAREDVREGVANEQTPTPDAALREKMLDRISDLGKGRFAQRLAAHMRTVDLRAVVASAAGVTDPHAEVDASGLARLGTASYLFLALDDISHKVRSLPLFPATTPGNGQAGGTDAAGQ